MKLSIVTTNPHKARAAKKALTAANISFRLVSMETPEIQAEDSKAVAEYSARFAADLLQTPVIITDAAWHISGLNGFPGPFLRYMNTWLTAADVL
nr:hypothetical protein [Patescibacteria group bacterium]